MDCQDLIELVNDYLEGTLAPPTHARFKQHLKGCWGCADYVEQMRVTIRLAGRTGLKPDQVPEALIRAFRDWRTDPPTKQPP